MRGPSFTPRLLNLRHSLARSVAERRACLAAVPAANRSAHFPVTQPFVLPLCCSYFAFWAVVPICLFSCFDLFHCFQQRNTLPLSFLVKSAPESTKRDADSSQMSSTLCSEQIVKFLRGVSTFALSTERSFLSHSVGVSKFERLCRG
jgi:hypothetical protein